MRSVEEVELVLALRVRGLNTVEIAEETGIPRGTIRDWVSGRVPSHSRRGPGGTCSTCGQPRHDPKGLPGSAYSYLLGMYLGDGCISSGRRAVYRLRIKTDLNYPLIILECAKAMRAVMPRSRVHVQQWVDGSCAAEIHSYSKAWPCLFPQHGAGRKHERAIELARWQDRMVRDHPKPFLRGLVHADGCRVLNRVNGACYPRYFFKQVSDDIRGLFCRTCRDLGIDYTLNRATEVSIARRQSVARMDEFIGPKT